MNKGFKLYLFNLKRKKNHIRFLQKASLAEYFSRAPYLTNILFFLCCFFKNIQSVACQNSELSSLIIRREIKITISREENFF